jgi:hypothetical protein
MALLCAGWRAAMPCMGAAARGTSVDMTESPADQEGFGPPDEEGIDEAKVEEQLAADPDEVPSAPNRMPDEPIEDDRHREGGAPHG